MWFGPIYTLQRLLLLFITTVTNTVCQWPRVSVTTALITAVNHRRAGPACPAAAEADHHAFII